MKFFPKYMFCIFYFKKIVVLVTYIFSLAHAQVWRYRPLPIKRI